MTRAASIVLASWLLCGCPEDESPEPPATCTDRDGGSDEIVTSLKAKDIVRNLSGNNAIVTLQINAVVPCLRGGMNVTGITNLGKLAEAKPGDKASIYLAPAGTNGAIGYAQLEIPYGFQAIVIIEAGDRTARLELGPIAKPRAAASDAGDAG